MESVENIQKMVDAAKQDATKLAKELAEMIEALSSIGLANTILDDPEFRKYMSVLGGGSISTPTPREYWTPPIPDKPKAIKAGKTGKGKRKGRASKVMDEDIIEFLKKEHNTGEVRKNLGQLVPKRLPGLEKAGKISMHIDGLKKLWKAE
jgi:hypothetical protein